MKHLGVDEKRFRRGQAYATIITDLDSGGVLEVNQRHDTDALARYYQGLSADQLQTIEAVAMDMHKPYVFATERHVPDGADKTRASSGSVRTSTERMSLTGRPWNLPG